MGKSKGIFWLDYRDNRCKRITRFFYKWLWCSWLHKKNRCYPRFPNRWHCDKCHYCGEGFDFLDGSKIRGWL